MRDSQKDFFYFRKKNAAHTDSILAQNAGTEPEEAFRRLSGRVFSYHTVTQPYLKAPEWLLAKEEVPPRDWLAYQFHQKHFSPVKLFLGQAGAEIDRDRFISTVTRNEGEPRNNVRFLIGAVGSGKSTFVSNLIVKNGNDWVTNAHLVPLRVDLDICLQRDKVPTKQRLLFTIYDNVRKTYRSLQLVDERLWEKIHADTPFNKAGETYDCEQALVRLFNRLRDATGNRTLLIIDNPDFIYHYYDRGLFVKEAGGTSFTTAQQSLVDRRQEAHEIIRYLIRAFIDDGALGQLGANILIVLRHDSLRHYTRTLHTDVPLPFDFDLHAYRVQPPSLDEVINSHVDLLKSVISDLPRNARTTAFAEAAEILSMPPSSDVSPIRSRLQEDLLSLSRQGLRQITLHNSQFMWLPIGIDREGERYQLVRRFQDRYSPSLLAFLLNGHRLFTQFTAEFPNVYLVRSDATEEHDDAWANLLLPHLHTYWLKRLMLNFIAFHERKDQTVTPSDVYNTFSEERIGPGGFEDSIVRLCLGSLAQVESSHVIDFEFAPSVNSRASYVVDEIRLTERGRRLVGGFIDTFSYLQIIVDDYLLPIPNCVADEFKYDSLDYGYLVDPPGGYRERLVQMVRKKIRQVYCFLDVLRIAMLCEERVFGAAFRKLRDRGIPIPEVDAIERKVQRDIVVVAHSCGDLDYRTCIPDREKTRERLKDELETIYFKVT